MASAQAIAVAGPQPLANGMQPNLAVQTDGRVAMAWKAADSICWRIVSAQGSPLGDNTCMNVPRSFPPVSVAALGSGYVLAWSEADSDASNTTYTIKTMTLSASGASGPIRSMAAPAVTFGLNMATLKSGEVAFSLYDGSHHRVMRIDTAGNVSTPLGSQIEMPNASSTIPAAGRITALADGGFLVAWDELDTARSRAIHMRLFDAAFQPRSGDLVKPGITEELDPVPAGLPDGGFAMMWRSAGTTVGVQRFNANGVAVGVPTPLDPAWLASPTATCYSPQPFTCSPRQETAAMVATADGGWIAFWHNLNPHGGWAATSARRFAADGTTVSAPTDTDPIPASRSDPLTHVVPTADGGFFVTWSSLDANYAAGIYNSTAWLQRFGGGSVH